MMTGQFHYSIAYRFVKNLRRSPCAWAQGRRPRHFLILFLAFILSSAGLLFADSPPVVIPAQYGRIESNQKAAKAQSPLLIIIQDAHAELEAQKSLAEILRSLVISQGLNLVMVEGGSGDVDLTYLREGVTPDHAKQVAERYLAAGKISGEEYLDLTLDQADIKLWGVEEPALYSQNMEAFLSFQKDQAQALAAVKKMKVKVLGLKKKYYPSQIQELDRLKEKSQGQGIAILDYFAQLETQARKASIKLDDFPKLSQWLAIKNAEKDLDASKAELEKNELIRILSQIASKEEMVPLAQQTPEADRESEIASLRYLLDLKKSYQTKLSGHSTAQIEKTLQLFESTQNLDTMELFGQADAVYRKIREKTLNHKKAFDTARLSDYLDLAEKLFGLQWTPDDERSFVELTRKGNPPETKRIAKWIPEASRFYELSHKREQAIFNNTLKKIETEQAKTDAGSKPVPIFVLIVGGYHAKILVSQFQTAGISVMNVTPRFKPSASPNPYFDILRQKWGSDASKS